MLQTLDWQQMNVMYHISFGLGLVSIWKSDQCLKDHPRMPKKPNVYSKQSMQNVRTCGASCLLTPHLIYAKPYAKQGKRRVEAEG